MYESYWLCFDRLVPKPAPTDWVDDNPINLARAGGGRVLYESYWLCPKS
ncbi:hypothetical protein MC7420_4977 [Coleofasciculus chthonoplastes PCC 7420]|uniref:Uncharacterized protein n=1 Tax=Coleofasciculus chthonoplastes PCC 7420 TaxID=118168 RepID=B4VZJ9_9CYAN|nr:hypothetical protein MC7420_4977 [Coleofasciculus chthonoplastes PCC 7420]